MHSMKCSLQITLTYTTLYIGRLSMELMCTLKCAGRIFILEYPLSTVCHYIREKHRVAHYDYYINPHICHINDKQWTLMLQHVLFTYCMHLQLLMYSQISISRSKGDVTETAAHMCSSISPSLMWGSAMVLMFSSYSMPIILLAALIVNRNRSYSSTAVQV
jgi:hypothetical protein